ncbi:S26 family signal peptidase [Leifsonia sp. P73]|uniref:S26 family signal peptidase n=1 Tax=Leifsonia sp. P73 TaxID=3423959 RepID=UPI003DA28F86
MIAILAAFWSTGWRWFIVESPSMGRTAPVGTLVVTSPVSVSAVHVGDVITFHPPTSPDETYTHRVREVTPPGRSSPAATSTVPPTRGSSAGMTSSAGRPRSSPGGAGSSAACRSSSSAACSCGRSPAGSPPHDGGRRCASSVRAWCSRSQPRSSVHSSA